MIYTYIASDKQGKVYEAQMDAQNLEEVLRHLSTRGLYPVSVKPLKGVARGLFGGKITLADKVFFTKYLALMLQVGTDLLSAIDILIADFEKPAVKQLLLEIRENLSKGKPFYEAFVKYPRVFSPVFINLVKAAESSGNLQHTFEELSVSLGKEAALRGNVRAALIYPAVILFASLAIFIFLSTFALPKIANVFLQGGIVPPTFSRVVFGVGLFVNDHIFVILIALFVFGTGLFYASRTSVGKQVLQQILWKTPVVRAVYQDIAIQRFAATFSSLIKAGLPIIAAIKITADVVGAEAYRTALIHLADEGLAKGLTVGEAFRRETAFPKVVTNLVAISEKAGHLENVLGTLSDFYAARVDSGVRTLVTVLEPILLLMMGGMVAVIALSIVIPIYQLTQTF